MDDVLGVCEFCHIAPAILEHHITPRSLGGGNEPDNVVRLCGECHRKAHRYGTAAAKKALEVQRAYHRLWYGRKET